MLLTIDSLRVALREQPQIAPVDGVSLSVEAGQCVALVGESGCGKSLTAMSVLRLLPTGLEISRGTIRYEGRDLSTLDADALRRLRGGEIGMVFQDPVGGLNPLLPVGRQIVDVLQSHRRLSRRTAQAQAVALLSQVGLPDAPRRSRSYPHELSGGMCQRVGIALAICCEPKLLIADEPTTALDVTVQAQILLLLRRLQQQRRMGLLFITHDLALVQLLADHVCVMYSGRIVEAGPARAVFRTPSHPYTQALLATVRSVARPGGRLPVIPGEVPTPATRPGGCAFHPRCARAADDPRCRETTPALESCGPQHLCACHKTPPTTS